MKVQKERRLQDYKGRYWRRYRKRDGVKLLREGLDEGT